MSGGITLFPIRLHGMGRDRSYFQNNRYQNNDLLTTWRRLLLVKLTGSQLVKKFPEFYGTRRFITSFTDPDTCPVLSQLHPVHTPTPHLLKIHLILSSHLHLGLPSGLFPSGFSTKTLYTKIHGDISHRTENFLILL